MEETDFNASYEGDGEERWELAWTEFDWENYLREQDQAARRYLSLYESHADHPDRLDEAARQMGWQVDGDEEDDAEDAEDPLGTMVEEEDEDDDDEDDDGTDEDGVPYTVHRHPVHVATQSLYFGLHRAFERIVRDYGTHLPPRLVLEYARSLHRAELDALAAVQALDLGDYALAICLLKRSLAELNETLRLTGDLDAGRYRAIARFQGEAVNLLFDLREIWLRVMRDCREELSQNGKPEE